MNNDEEKLNNNTNTNSSFNSEHIESNVSHKRKSRIYIPIIITVAILLVICVPFVSIFLRTENSVNIYKRNYSVNEIVLAESNTFHKLNSINYPNGEDPIKTNINDAEKTAYSNFSNQIYHSLVNTSKNDNMSYSIVGLYSIVNEMTYASNRYDLKERLNNLLGLNEKDRVDFYSKIIKANSFGKENSTIQIKNGAFFNNKFNYSDIFLNTLTNLYCEAYQLDLMSDGNKIINWVDEATNSKNFVNEKFLEIDDETQLLLLSTLYFKNSWAQKYLSSDNVIDNFHLSNGNKIESTFMNHTYLVNQFYDYGKYIAIRDYYYLNNASITYLLPKNYSDNIFDLTKNVNIFVDNDNYKIEQGEKPIAVHLKTPKFSLKNEVDFKECFINLGFGDIFNRDIDSFKNAFDDETLKDYRIYMQTMKQKNEVEFNEDGTIVKNLTLGGFGAATSPGPIESIDVNLDQPFIYIIRDANDCPIFVGHIDNPSI